MLWLKKFSMQAFYWFASEALFYQKMPKLTLLAKIELESLSRAKNGIFMIKNMPKSLFLTLKTPEFSVFGCKPWVFESVSVYLTVHFRITIFRHQALPGIISTFLWWHCPKTSTEQYPPLLEDDWRFQVPKIFLEQLCPERMAKISWL